MGNSHHKTKHGKAYTKVYSVWKALKGRCTNPKNTNYPRYGGAGITLDARWLDFENFYEDMGDPPTEQHTIDRENNSLGYSRENCCWKTHQEQQRNKSTNLIVEYEGEKMCLAAWCEKLNLNYAKTNGRLSRLKWSVERAFTTP